MLRVKWCYRIIETAQILHQWNTKYQLVTVAAAAILRCVAAAPPLLQLKAKTKMLKQYTRGVWICCCCCCCPNFTTKGKDKVDEAGIWICLMTIDNYPIIL
ncbi:unnamed protein product [Cuscuta epithymum]|uniref:Secreted protein n=1 Tax=Cuscuta epithymum TaxID=186058 RepID=A0AAV0CPN6_9ASTE|nr:unnamed protein product [Cuscuta epithymum]